MKKNRSIQGLRGLFAVGVMLSHMSFLSMYSQTSSLFNNCFSNLANVSFFFMLAGFFLAKTYKADIAFRDYLTKKLKRIYPLHLVLLLIFITPPLLHGKLFESFDLLSLIANVLLIQAFFPGDAISFINPVAWYLSSLLVCYILGYYFIKLMRKKGIVGRRVIISIVTILILYKIIFSVILPSDGVMGLGYHLVYRCPLAGLCDFCIGILVFDVLCRVQIRRKTLWQIISIILQVFMFVSISWLPSNVASGFYMIPFNILILISFADETDWSRAVFGNKLLAFLGDISYEVYMIHYLVIMHVSNLGRKLSLDYPYIIMIAIIIITILFSLIWNKLNRLICTKIK